MNGARIVSRLVSRVACAAFVAAVVAVLEAAAATPAVAGTELIGFPSDRGPAMAPACDSRQPSSEGATPAPAASPGTPAVVIVSDAVLLSELQALAETPEAPRAPKAPKAPKAVPRVRVVDASRVRAGATSTDTTVAVRRGTKLMLHNFGGSVNLTGWAQSSVRVRAEHSRRDWVSVGIDGDQLEIQSRSRTGPSRAVDYEITIPSWMPVSLSGVYNDVTAEDVKGGISVETVSGDIKVRRAAGDIELRSVEGLVDLMEANGKVIVSSVNDGVRVVNVTGDVMAEAVNGDILLLDLTSKSVEATTVNGTVLYDGKILDDGAYMFSTHNGDIGLGLSDRSNATVSVATFSGEFESWTPVNISRTKKGKRFSFLFGSGSAKIDLESFQGAIQLFRPGEKEFRMRFEAEKEHQREMEEEHEHEHENVNDEDDDDD
ncbi:MAG: DUF4097 family beta strand repeat-containing protein [Candidatus Eiseniibacteriota bacterium]